MGVSRAGVGTRDVIELHGSVGGQVHRVGLPGFIKWRFEVVGIRSTGWHPGGGGHGPGIIVVGSLRELRVKRSRRCLWRPGRPRRSVRRGDRISRSSAKKLSSLAVRAVNCQVGDMDVVAYSVTLTGVVVLAVQGARPSLLATAFLVGMIGKGMEAAEFVFVLGPGAVLGPVSAGLLAFVASDFILRGLLIVLSLDVVEKLVHQQGVQRAFGIFRLRRRLGRRLRCRLWRLRRLLFFKFLEFLIHLLEVLAELGIDGGLEFVR